MNKIISYAILFINFVIQYFKFKPLRFLLNTMAVASGIALFVSIQIVNEATLKSIKDNIDAIAGKSEITITARSAGFTDKILEQVENASGVLYAIPMIEERGTVLSKKTDETTQLTILGVDMLKEKNVRSYDTEDEDIIEDPLEFLNQPDSIIITRQFADRFKLSLDDDFDLLTVNGQKKFIVRGVMIAKGAAKAFGGSIALMDIDGASHVFGKSGKYDRIDIVTDDDSEPRDVVASLSRDLGPAYDVQLSAARSENLTRVVSAFQRLLLIFASLAWLIGLFLVFSSVNMSVELRRREIGMLRATGATRSLVLFLFTAEGSIIGFIGGILGAVSGIYLASGMLGFITNTLSAQFHTVIEQPGLSYSVHKISLVVLLSLIVSALSALWPALKATKIHPLEAIRLDTKIASVESQLGRGLIGRFLILVSRFFAWRKWPVADLAARNLLIKISDVRGNVIILSLSLFFALFMGTTSHSMKTSMLRSMDQFSNWDMLVTAPGDAYSQDLQPFAEDIGQSIHELLKDVAHSGQGLSARRLTTYSIGGEVARVTALGPLDSRDMCDRYYRLLGDEHIETMKIFFSSDEPIAVISEDLSKRLNKSNGDSIEINLPAGHFNLKIIGVIRDYEFAGGNIYMPRDQYKRMWSDNLISSIGVELTNPFDIESVKSRVDNQKVISMPLMVTMLAPFVADVKQKIDEAFMFSWPLQAAAFVVAFLGIVSTLIVKTMARMRELGGLRAVGMDKNQVVKMLLVEGALQALIGLCCIMIGIPLLWAWVHFLIPVVMNWVVDFYFPWLTLAVVYVSGILLVLISSYFPARWVIRENIGIAIRYE